MSDDFDFFLRPPYPTWRSFLWFQRIFPLTLPVYPHNPTHILTKKRFLGEKSENLQIQIGTKL